MKNAAIRALIHANFTRISVDESLKEVNVECDYSIGNMYVFNAVTYSSSKVGGSQDIITKFEVRIDNTDKEYESNMSVFSEDVAEMLKVQYKREKTFDRVIRTAPEQFTYFLTSGDEREVNLNVNINEISRECY